MIPLRVPGKQDTLSPKNFLFLLDGSVALYMSLGSLVGSVSGYCCCLCLFSACVCCAFCHFRLSNICRLLAYCQANFFLYFVLFCKCVCVLMIAKQAYTKLTSCIGFTRICPPVRLFLSICNASQSLRLPDLSVGLSICPTAYSS